VTTHLAHDILAQARRYAEAQAENGTILGALRAEVRRQFDDPAERRKAVAVLQVLHDDDQEELSDFRDYGRARVQLFLYAAVMGRRLNADLEERAEEEGGALAEPQQLSAGMFFIKAFCVEDPAKVQAEAEAMVSRMEQMSESEQVAAIAQMALAHGLGLDTLTEMARQKGLRLVEAGEGAA